MNICKEICPIFSGVCVPDECDIFKNHYSDLFDENEKLKIDVGYYTDQAFWAETTLEKMTKDRDSLLEQTVKLKKEIDQHLKVISELHDRYDDVRGR